jgi:hypothetical protein
LFEESNDIYLESGDNLQRCSAILNVAEVRLELGRPDAALEAATDAVEECSRRDKDARFKGFAHLALSKALWHSEQNRDRKTAVEHASTAMRYATEGNAKDLREEAQAWAAEIDS